MTGAKLPTLAIVLLLATALAGACPGSAHGYSLSLAGGVTNVTTRDSSEYDWCLRANVFANPEPEMGMGLEVGFYHLGAPFGPFQENAHARVIQTTLQVRSRGTSGPVRPTFTGGFGLYVLRPPGLEGSLGEAHLGWNAGLGVELGQGRTRFLSEARWHWIQSDEDDDRFLSLVFGVTYH